MCTHFSTLIKICLLNGDHVFQLYVPFQMGLNKVVFPLLFIIYTDELLISLRSTSVGCHVGNIVCVACGYADDVILLVPTFNNLNKTLNICEIFGNEYNVLFNSTKSQLLLFENYHVNIHVITRSTHCKVCK
jgi:hypothetical protein